MRKFYAYLHSVVEQVRKHGASKLSVVTDSDTLRFGFASPSGKFLIHVHDVKVAYKSVACSLKGGSTCAPSMGVDEVSSFYEENFEAAVLEGVRLRKLDEMN
jgi:hypothetical protein